MINGKSVYLRLPELSDLEELYELANNEENRSFLNFHRPMSKIDEENWIRGVTEKASKGVDYGFVIVEKKSNKVVGTTGIHNIKQIQRMGTIGITIKKEFQEKGYGPESIKLLLKWGFDTLNLNLIGIEAFSTNERAIHVYRDKLKFKEEARLRMRHYKNGKYLDSVVLSMSREEYDEM